MYSSVSSVVSPVADEVIAIEVQKGNSFTQARVIQVELKVRL